MVFIVFTYGYSSFKPWSVENFFIYYAMVILAPVLYVFWKVMKRTKIVSSKEVDLIWDAPVIDAYEETFYEAPLGFWKEVIGMFGFKSKGAGDHQRAREVEP